MKLDLPNVTLLFVETRAHKITKRVIDDCTSKCNFGDILLFTDKPELIPVDGARYIAVPDFPNKKEAGQFYYQFAMNHVQTDFALMLEWDAGIRDTSMWTPEFFNYDYIGAPWNVPAAHENKTDVGNGGFTLMSKRLGKFLHDNAGSYPVFTDIDVCQKQRPRLEAQGFKWPGRDLAKKFSWELTEKPEDNKVFGFHANFTWPWMIDRAEIIERAKLLTETEYLLSKIGPLLKEAPWLETELPPEAWAKVQAYRPTARIRDAYGRMLSPEHRMNMNRLLLQRRAIIARSSATNPELKA